MKKCIVENCNSTNGIPFPAATEERFKLISSLKLDGNPNESSIICLEHFKKPDSNDCAEDDSVLNKQKQEASVCAVSDDISKEQSENVVTSACRICAKTDNLEMSIFESVHGEIIASMIMMCCHPVTLTQNDGYPHMICTLCLQQLETAYKFRNQCLKVNEIWHKQRLSIKRKQLDDDFPAKKQHVENVSENSINSKDNMANVCSTALNIQNQNKNDIQQETVDIVSSEPPPLVLIENKGNCDKQITDTEYYEIQAEKLRSTPTTKEDNTLLAQSKGVKNQVIKYTNSKVIPDSITTKTQKKFESSTGIYSCSLTHGLQESIFVMADGYLFTFGLLKGHTRHLRCVLPNCRGKAEQILLDKDTYEDNITVKIPHSHKVPNDQLRKKHMFFHVMRKRMQHDKTLNIRSIYEQVCIQEPEIRQLVPLRNVINEICKYQVTSKLPRITSFKEFCDKIEGECYEKLHFTNTNKQFYQERFYTEDGSMAVVFCNTDIIETISESRLMYVDASFKIDTFEDFKYQLVTVLVWVDDNYYPILYALLNEKTQEIFKKVFQYLHDVLAPNLRPHEIVTDFEANLYYALGEIYLDSHIGGSIFYYTQNLYKKICSLNLSRELETNSNFRNLYHMLLMLPLLPVNTISDALKNIELQAKELGLSELTKPIFDHIQTQWILNVTTEMFCVHRLENRINDNVIAPFKKLRDYLLLFKGKVNQTLISIGQVVEKLIELESFLHEVYTKSDKKAFGRDPSSFQKKNVIRAWQYIETHPKINPNNFFQKVLGYIKCMENQLWIWGFYRYTGSNEDILINAANTSIFVGENNQSEDVDYEEVEEDETETDVTVVEYADVECQNAILSADNPTILMEAVIDNDGGVVLQSNTVLNRTKLEKTFFKYIKYE